MQINKKFWNKKKVLVTGHTGFKGTWLTLFLTFLGSKVVGLSSGIPSKPSLFQILKLSKKIRDIRVDVRDLKKMKIIFKKHTPDYVFHLAAQSLVKRSFKNPIYLAALFIVFAFIKRTVKNNTFEWSHYSAE